MRLYNQYYQPFENIDKLEPYVYCNIIPTQVGKNAR